MVVGHFGVVFNYDYMLYVSTFSLDLSRHFPSKYYVCATYTKLLQPVDHLWVTTIIMWAVQSSHASET